MFKRALNECTIKLHIQPKSALLIKSGQESGANPLLPSMNFVRSPHPRGLGSTIYLPGSSLKGVIRSRAEQIVRTLGLPILEFSNHEKLNAISKEILAKADGNDGELAWQNACTITRTFGSTFLGGRVSLSDFYPGRAIDVLPVRAQVAIDRRSGGVSAGPFTMEIAPPIEPGTNEPIVFSGTIRLMNFERWQLALLALVIRDMNAEMVTIGFGAGRGLGLVNVAYGQLEIHYPGIFSEAFQPQAATHLLGISQLGGPQLAGYGIDAYELNTEAEYPSSAVTEYSWGRAAISIGEDNLPSIAEDHALIEAVLQRTIPDWIRYIESPQARGETL